MAQNFHDLQREVDAVWERGETLYAMPDCLAQTLSALDSGEVRAAEPDVNAKGGWRTNIWVKKAILLYFQIHPTEIIDGPGNTAWFDKVPTKFRRWGRDDFLQAGFRATPGSVVRFGAFIGKNTVLMPSFVNIGGYVGEESMVDTWATVGSCAQIGFEVHLSGGVGIGGVLEPPQENPTIIEDGAFIGARSEVAEGVIVRRRAVLSMGVFIGKRTPIIDRVNGDRIITGEVPENAVVLMGVHPTNNLVCPHIVKYRDEQTDARTALNEVLHGGGIQGKLL